ncbi:NYN domain-containing protein [uncultured Rikenella sp.]|uniref:NYN domain-containing protein n=1 Tax=uncultured Rikenella sp. TaxID=368003 RepID=UPI0026263DDE|nr:NYN domain-containing protein [uncultured Rikenella sp.]
MECVFLVEIKGLTNLKIKGKMKNCVIIVDNSNVWIEGRKFSAKSKGITSQAGEKDINDPSWRIDFGKLLSVVAGKQNIQKAILVGSRPPISDSVWEAAKNQGFTVIVHDRNFAGKEKAVDTELVAQGAEIICTTTEPATLKLLSGDRDFIPLINLAIKRGWETEMWAFSNAFNEHGEMAQSVASVKPLDYFFSEIGRYEFEWPSSSTVNPK